LKKEKRKKELFREITVGKKEISGVVYKIQHKD